MKLPESIEKIVGDEKYSIDTIGMSDSTVISFNDMVLKIEKENQESNKEHEIMKWLNGKLPVPKIKVSEKEDNINYLLMTKIKGKMICDCEEFNEPMKVVKLLVEGLKMLWKIDISVCPFDSTLDKKLSIAEYRVKNNLINIDNTEPETFGVNGFKNPEELLKWLKENKTKEDLVFTHGDYCLPNIFTENNKISGFIDLGRGGIADKYQDIAICYRSLKNNYNGFYGGKVYDDFSTDMLFEELGFTPDYEKIKYYILLDELF